MIVETFDEFCAKHGEYLDLSDGWRIFADGAAARYDGFGRLTARREVPSDPIELLRVQRVFISTKLEREQSDFRGYRNAVREQANNAIRHPQACPPPRADAAAQLKRGQARCRALQQQLKVIDELLAQAPLAAARRQQGHEETERRKQLTAQLHEVEGLNAD